MSRSTLIAITGVLLVAALGMTAVSAVQRTRTQRSAETTATGDTSVTTLPDPAPPRPATPPKPAPRPEPTFSVVRVRAGRTAALRSKPNGRVLATVGSTTEFGSATALAVAARRGDWLGLTSTDLPNGKLGWVKAHNGSLQAHRTHMSVRIDLSRRRLELRDGRKLVRHAKVGIGRPGSATPTGRFSITDKLQNTYGPYYGCCILALSGHQVNTPAGWKGGDRLAIHGTDNPGSIGVPSSAGCLHADADDLKVLMRRVPLGTPVFIHA